VNSGLFAEPPLSPTAPSGAEGALDYEDPLPRCSPELAPTDVTQGRRASLAVARAEGAYDQIGDCANAPGGGADKPTWIKRIHQFRHTFAHKRLSKVGQKGVCGLIHSVHDFDGELLFRSHD
jgi:hypothetical protein